jgi:hypothetical protein
MPARTTQLHVEVHAGWAVKADQPGMDGDVGILSLGAWLVFWSPEIDRVFVTNVQSPSRMIGLSSRSFRPPSPWPFRLPFLPVED